MAHSAEKPRTRNQIYRMARSYHFEHYGSSRFGHGEHYRDNTIAATLALLIGVFFAVKNWPHGNSNELIVAVLMIVGGLIVAVRNAPEWHNYAKLARNFATIAADGAPATADKGEVEPCTTPNEIIELYERTYPWLCH